MKHGFVLQSTNVLCAINYGFKRYFQKEFEI